jgi:E3 ubiquitin-protein ligase TRIP12
MMLLDDMEEDMDEEDGIFLEEGPEDEDDEGGDQLQEKTVELEISNDGSKPQGITPNGTRVATPVQDTSAADASRVTAIPPKTRSYAAALKAPTTDYHYRFLIDGHDVGHQESLYGALTRVKRLGGNGARVGFFERHVLKVRKCEGPAPLPDCEPDAAEHVDPASEEGLPWPLKKDSPQAVVLRMLRIIHAINEDQRDRLGENNARVLDETTFVNAKITAKFIRQLDEILLVAW